MENIPVLSETGSQQIQEANSFVQDTQCHVEQVISSTDSTPLVETQAPAHAQVDEILEHSSFNTTHNSYTIAYKIAVLDWYHDNGENKSLTSKHFGVARKRIRDWCLMEDQLRSMPQANRLRKRNPSKGYGRRPPGSIDLDQAILDWYKKQRESGVMVYSRQLRAKALELSPQCGLPETFKASSQWLHNWKKRYAADIKEWSDGGEGVVSDDVENTVTLPSDFEEHLRRLEQVGADLAAGQDDSLAMVASTPEVATTQLQVGQGSDLHNITLTSNPIRPSMDTANAVSELHPHPQVVDGLGDKSTLEEKIKEQDQWLEVVEQTLENLETEVMKKLGQVKLILHQLKTGQECLKEQLQSMTTHQSEATSTILGKRPGTDGVANSSGQNKRSRNT